MGSTAVAIGIETVETDSVRVRGTCLNIHRTASNYNRLGKMRTSAPKERKGVSSLVDSTLTAVTSGSVGVGSKKGP